MDVMCSPKKSNREENEIRPMPACSETRYDSDSDIAAIIEKAELYINTCYGHKLEEGVECNNHRAFKRSFSLDENSLEKDNLKDFLRTEISPAQLKMQEDSILSGGSTEDTCVDEVDGSEVCIHTVHFKPRDETDTSTSPVPLVMLHGLGGSAVTFSKNYEKLSESRDVYGLDLPGFGLSSREANFPSCATHSSDEITEELVLQCEDRVIELIDKWREEKKLGEVILVGHSFGGYIASVYAMKHRERVRHLILIDPWGMMTKEETCKVDSNPLKKNNLAIRLAMGLSQRWHLKPFDIPRAGGHTIGVLIMQVAVKKSQKEAYGKDTMEYFVDVNSRLPTGEKLFGIVSGYSYLFPVLSIKTRLLQHPDCPPMTFIYGSDPLYSTLGGKMLQECMGDRVTVEKVADASHHIHVQNPDGFHRVMMEALDRADNCKSQPE